MELALYWQGRDLRLGTSDQIKEVSIRLRVAEGDPSETDSDRLSDYLRKTEAPSYLTAKEGRHLTGYSKCRCFQRVATNDLVSDYRYRTGNRHSTLKKVIDGIQTDFEDKDH